MYVLIKYTDIFVMPNSPSTVIDSRLFGDMFSTSVMRTVFSDDALIARYIETEVALALAEGRVGVIPADAAARIASALSGQETVARLDMVRLKTETEIVGYPILPLIKQLAQLCGEDGRYLHWGATTQDIMDCAIVLQIRSALAIVEDDLKALHALLADLSRQYRDTPMPGRTHLQHALPITFGYKCAIWLSMVQRHQQRLRELKPRVLVGQFAGAAGTLASLGNKGLAVQTELCRELKLAVPTITWHVARDGLAEVTAFLGIVTGSLAKIATDIMLMMANELGEAFEPFVHGRGASSTMPQKRNPISCELIIAASKAVRHHAALTMEAMVHDFERSTGPWNAEWISVPQAFLHASGALHQARHMLGGLEVNAERMRANLDITSGLIVAEAVMMGLSPHLGRQLAHDVVYDACREAQRAKQPLATVLIQMPDITRHLSAAEIERLCDPQNYLGSAAQMVDRVLSVS
jgi:3-carboxy-cis,cis-muconate cycloisomerase